MTDGTSQGLFVVIAIIIFGIFVGLAYTAFGDVLQPKMVNLFEEALDFKLDKGGSEETPDIPVEPEKAIYFADENLEWTVRNVLKLKPDEIITADKMKNLTELKGSYFANVKNLMGLEYAVNLEIFDTNISNPITDITPLANLTNLKEINIKFANVKNLEPLKNLKNLEKLDLTSTNNAGDFSVLSNLTNLKELNLSQNNITVITDISKLTKLEKLTLSYNQITDISILTNLTNLKYLDLSSQWNNTTYKTISDIKPLYNLSNLEYLNLKTNGNIPESQIKYIQENSPKLTTLIQP